MKIWKYLTLVICATFFTLSSANAVCTTIGCAASQAIHDVYNNNKDNPIWTQCAQAGQDAQDLGKCIGTFMADASIKEEYKTEVTEAVGGTCYSYCNSQTCKKHFGIGGDTNCKAVCCPAKAADKIKNCCAAAGDKSCCG